MVGGSFVAASTHVIISVFLTIQAHLCMCACSTSHLQRLPPLYAKKQKQKQKKQADGDDDVETSSSFSSSDSDSVDLDLVAMEAEADLVGEMDGYLTCTALIDTLCFAAVGDPDPAASATVAASSSQHAFTQGSHRVLLAGPNSWDHVTC
jgi:hypothetical protein